MTTLKTQNSYRRIPFIGEVEEMLKSQKAKQRVLKKNLKDRYRATGEFEDVVFCTTMGSPVTRYIAEKEINKVVDAINFELPKNAKCVCIGDVTAKAMGDHPYILADEISADGIVKAIINDYNN